ncbi:DUF3892 domain-containing protein [Legionella maioricensis]|uniref:DUF3892 domain-containing protein n=1 Tax=Legionella maioricensis TaxID=2896528 RepID=A0A9X2D2A3_9GAMM|nr:DUF3892 domain-containing protein [Legionella maioricensis]MCL9685138.1 DUF3892 domain-containing protein [Legionella maioricensis]MCL9688349.1 DUF3892 domain-containing protein [Legionella maioricensis]
MTPAYEIVCIKRPTGLLQDIHHEITEIGYKDPRAGLKTISIHTVIAMIENEKCSFYVTNNGSRINVQVINKKGLLGIEPYLCTMENGVETDNLENLPSCY